jgi:hypothetical protein
VAILNTPYEHLIISLKVGDALSVGGSITFLTFHLELRYPCTKFNGKIFATIFENTHANFNQVSYLMIRGLYYKTFYGCNYFRIVLSWSVSLCQDTYPAI